MLKLLLVFLCCLLFVVVVSEAPECRIPTIKLSNGVDIPQLMLGTAHLVTEGTDIKGFLPEKVYRSVELALKSGMRGFDSALIYRSHRAIGQVLGDWFFEGDLKREDIFLTTKVFHGKVDIATANSVMPSMEDLTPEEVSDIVREQFERSLHEVGVGYFDLVLLHWPAEMNSKHAGNPARRLAAWKILEEYYERGWIRAIGVSNFSELHIQGLLDDGAKIRPMVNQIEASVYLQFEDIIKYCKDNEIALQAYSPLGRGISDISSDPVMLGIAEKHGKNYGQIALRYLVQKGFAVTSLSSSPDRIRSNQDIFFFELDEEDMEKLSKLARPDGSWGLPSPYDMS